MKLIILKNDIKVLLVIGLLVLAASSCKKEVVSVSGEESVETIVDSNVVYLDRDLYTEEYIKKNVGKGMSAVQVEEIVGEPYKIDGFMGTERASYLLSPPNTSASSVK